MKKKKDNELLKNRMYRASDKEEKRIKELHRKSKLDMSLSRYKVSKMLTE